MGNFYEAEIFCDFAIIHQLVKIRFHESFFLQKFLDDEFSTMSSSHKSSNSTQN